MDFIAIFKNQLSAHVKKVNELLLQLEQDRDDINLHQSLMREFHTIKGAARAVQFDEIRQTAHYIEEIYHSIAQGDAKPKKGVVRLTRFSLKVIEDCLSCRLSKVECTAHRCLDGLVTAYQNNEKLEFPDLLSGLSPDILPDSSPGDTPKVIETETPGKKIKPDFIEIFKNEVAGHIKEVTRLCLELENDIDNQKLYESLMREFHTIKGAARAIQFDEVKDIAHKIEDIYHSIMKGKSKPRDSLIDLTLHAIDLVEGCLASRLSGSEFSAHKALPGLVKGYLAGEKITIPRTDPSTPTEAEQYPEPARRERNGRDRRYSAPQFENFEGFTDSLLNIAGELNVAIGSIKDQRQIMQRTNAQLTAMGGTLGRKTQADSLDLKTANALKNMVQEIFLDQRRALEILDNSETRFRFLSDELDSQVTKARLVPLDVVFSTYPRIVRDLSHELKKECCLTITGGETRIDRGILDAVRVPFLHLIRNALDHGIELPGTREKLGKPKKAQLKISAVMLGAQIRVTISDDGAGIDMEKLKSKVIERKDTILELWDAMTLHEKEQFLFLPGLTTATEVTDTSGRGVGLDVVKTEVEKVGGRIRCENRAPKGVSFILELPLTLSMTRCLLVRGGEHPYFGEQFFAFPANEVGGVQRIGLEDLRSIDGQDAVRLKDKTILIYDFSRLMGLVTPSGDISKKHLILLNDQDQTIGLLVEKVLDEQHVVRRRMDERLGKMRDIDGITLLRDGSIALLVDLKDVVQSVGHMQGNRELTQEKSVEQQGDIDKAHILVVEDSKTVREVERHFLESGGYRVTTAVDGMDGLNRFTEEKFDLIISDIDMPRMNGIDMIRKIRTETDGSKIPIIVVSYKDREDDHREAKDAGANLFVTKAEFDSAQMLQKIEGLLEDK